MNELNKSINDLFVLHKQYEKMTDKLAPLLRQRDEIWGKIDDHFRGQPGIKGLLTLTYEDKLPLVFDMFNNLEVPAKHDPNGKGCRQFWVLNTPEFDLVVRLSAGEPGAGYLCAELYTFNAGNFKSFSLECFSSEGVQDLQKKILASSDAKLILDYTNGKPPSNKSLLRGQVEP